MMKYFYIMAGGAIGSVLRYIVSDFITVRNSSPFPYGTFSVNIIGSLIIGFLFGLFAVNGILDQKIKFFMFVGVLGGFTTFSSFVLETMELLQAGEFIIAFSYMLLSNVLGIAMVMAGYFGGVRFK